MQPINIKRVHSHWARSFANSFVLLLIFTLAIVVTQWRFNPWLPEVFFGDDLINILAHREGKFPSTLAELLTYGDGGKFRPVYIWVLGSLQYLFQTNIGHYMLFNAFLNGVNACCVFVIARHLTNGHDLVAGSIAIVTAASRFSLYQVSQVAGVLESVGTMLLLLTIYCLLRYTKGDQDRAMRWALASVIFSVLAFHTHEIFVGLVVWTAFAIALLPTKSKLSIPRKVFCASISMFAVIVNVIHKHSVLDTPVLMGTGGQIIGVDPPQILSHTLQAFLSIAGINEGPNYLVGLRLLSGESWLALIFGAIFFLGWIILIANYCVSVASRHSGLKEKWLSVSWLVLFALLAILLVIPAIMTIRVEQRWLLDSFILLLFALAFVVGARKTNNMAPTYVAFILWCLFVSDTIVSTYFDRVYMVESCRFAAAVKNELIENRSVNTGHVILLAKTDHCKWTLLNGGFFSLYNDSPTRFECVDSLEAIANKELESDARIYQILDHKLVDITETLKLSQ